MIFAQVVVRLAGGVGVSLVSHKLEELCFMSLTGIEVSSALPCHGAGIESQP